LDGTAQAGGQGSPAAPTVAGADLADATPDPWSDRRAWSAGPL